MNGSLCREKRAEEAVAEKDPAILVAVPEENENDLRLLEDEDCLARALLAQAPADAAAIFASSKTLERWTAGEKKEE